MERRTGHKRSDFCFIRQPKITIPISLQMHAFFLLRRFSFSIDFWASVCLQPCARKRLEDICTWRSQSTTAAQQSCRRISEESSPRSLLDGKNFTSLLWCSAGENWYNKQVNTTSEQRQNFTWLSNPLFQSNRAHRSIQIFHS